MDENQTRNPVEVLNGAYESLTRTQKRIASFILNNLNETSFMTLTEFCEKADITAVTMGRFTKAIGYRNFADFKKDLQDYVTATMMPKKDLLKGFNPNTHIRSFSDFYTSVALDELKLLEYSYNLIDEDLMRQTVTIMENARRVYLLAGYGICHPVAEIFKIRLINIGVDVEILETTNPVMLSNQLYKMTDEDALIAFSFPNYISDVIAAAKYAASIHAKIICMTDQPGAPIVPYADVVLLTKTYNPFFFNSMTGPVSVCNTIATMLYWKTGAAHGSDEKRYDEIYSLVLEHFRTPFGELKER